MATEDVVYMLHSMNIATGIDLNRLIDTSHWFSSQVLNRESVSKVTRAVMAKKPK